MDRTINLLQQEQAKLRVTMEQLHAGRLTNMEEMLLQQRNLTQSLTQDLERMRLAESDRLESERLQNEQRAAGQQEGPEGKPKARKDASWLQTRFSILRGKNKQPKGEKQDESRQQTREAEVAVSEPPADKAAKEQLSARLLQESAAQAEHVGEVLDELRARMASGASLPHISGVNPTGIGIHAESINGSPDLTSYSVRKSGRSRWCDACLVAIGAYNRFRKSPTPLPRCRPRVKDSNRIRSRLNDSMPRLPGGVL